MTYITKDSGARAEFGSGMVRDTDEGKARFDLCVPEGLPYGAQMLTRLAMLMTRGAAKYDARNWEKAQTEEELDRFRESAFRHFMQWMTGERDEDHAAAVMFNIMGAELVEWKLANLAADAPDVRGKAADLPAQIMGFSVETPTGARLMKAYNRAGDMGDVVAELERIRAEQAHPASVIEARPGKARPDEPDHDYDPEHGINGRPCRTCGFAHPETDCPRWPAEGIEYRDTA